MKRTTKKEPKVLFDYEAPITRGMFDDDGDESFVGRPAQRDDHLSYGGDDMRSILSGPQASAR